MGVDVGIAQLGGYPVLEALRNIVLQAFGFFVNFIPWIIQEIVKKPFQEPMMAHNFQRTMLPRRRQDHTVMLLIVDPSRFMGCELLKHARYRRRSDAKPFRQSVTGDPFFFRPAQFEYCFKIIVDRFCGGETL